MRLPLRRRLGVARQHGLQPVLGIAVHGAQLEHADLLAVAPLAGVAEEGRTGIDRLDRQGRERDQRGRNDGARNGNRKVQKPTRRLARKAAALPFDDQPDAAVQIARLQPRHAVLRQVGQHDDAGVMAAECLQLG